MTTMLQGNKKITTRKIPAMNNKVLVRTGSLRFFKKYRQPIIKFWSVPVPVSKTVRFLTLSIGTFHFCILRSSKFSSMRSPLCFMFWSVKSTVLHANDNNFKLYMGAQTRNL